MATFQYFAFISYQRKDEDWAEWFQHQLEHYHLPANIAADRPDLPQEIRPLFRDKTELAGGILANEIRSALESSRFLIVLCSPNSAKSEWVAKEVQTFINMGRVAQIIPLIIGGIPYDDEQECFTPTLKKLRKTDKELLGINVAEMGREVASIKLVAQMLGLKFDSLWQRYEREKEEEERRIKEQRDKLLKVQSHFLAEKAHSLITEGNSYTARLLALEALPKIIESPDRPYVFDAEVALRKACVSDTAVFPDASAVAVCPDDLHFAVATSEGISIKDIKSGGLIRSLEVSETVNSLLFSSDGQLLIAGIDEKAIVWTWPRLVQKFVFYVDYHKGMVYNKALGLNISPDNTKLAVIYGPDEVLENHIRIYDLKTGQSLYEYAGHHVCFSGKKSWVATVRNDIFSKEQEAFIYNLDTGDTVSSFKIKSDRVRHISFCPDGQKLAVLCDGKIKIFEKGIIRNTIDDIHVSYFSYVDNPKCLITTSNGKIHLRDFNGNIAKTITVCSDYIANLSYGKSFVLCLSDQNRLYLRRWRAYNPILEIKSFKKLVAILVNGKEKWNGDRFITEVHFDNGGNEIYAILQKSLSKEFFSFESKKTLCRWDANTGALLEEKELPKDYVSSQEVSKPSGSVQASDKNNHIEGLKIPSLFEDKETISPNGNIKATTEMNIVKLWDIKTMKLIVAFAAHDDPIKFIEFNPSGNKILTASYDGYIRIWPFHQLQNLIDETREAFRNRTLTPIEKKTYYLDE
jgi:WD40 repeat protein